MRFEPIAEGIVVGSNLTVCDIFEKRRLLYAFTAPSFSSWSKISPLSQAKPVNGGSDFLSFVVLQQLPFRMAAPKQNVTTPTIAELKKALKRLEDETDRRTKDIKTRLAQKIRFPLVKRP